jgi:hypothetical protein
MPATPPPTTEQDVKGALRLRAAASIGLAGAIVGIVVPIAFVLLASYNPGGFFTFASQLVELTAILVLAGAILLLISFFVYRRSFAALRKVDPRFVVASVLCIIGSIGFLLLVVSAAVVAGNSSSLLTCLHGQPSHALSCLRSGQPLGAYTALAGFWLSWIGGVGLVLGLFSAGSRFQRRVIAAGGAVYALLLIVLIGPFVALVTSVPGTEYIILVVPVLSIAAPALVLSGRTE